MSFKIGPLIKTSTADGAFVWRFFHVQNLVHRQSPRLAETFAAFRAFERLFFRVDVSNLG